MLDPHLEEWALLGRHILVLLDGIELIRDYSYSDLSGAYSYSTCHEMFVSALHGEFVQKYLKLILLQTIKNVLH
jgi:hypothetical protein